jgi:hypothetical protein
MGVHKISGLGENMNRINYLPLADTYRIQAPQMSSIYFAIGESMLFAKSNQNQVAAVVWPNPTSGRWFISMVHLHPFHGHHINNLRNKQDKTFDNKRQNNEMIKCGA